MLQMATTSGITRLRIQYYDWSMMLFFLSSATGSSLLLLLLCMWEIDCMDNWGELIILFRLGGGTRRDNWLQRGIDLPLSFTSSLQCKQLLPVFSSLY